jgi:hypothetical protein
MIHPVPGRLTTTSSRTLVDTETMAPTAEPGAEASIKTQPAIRPAQPKPAAPPAGAASSPPPA